MRVESVVKSPLFRPMDAPDAVVVVVAAALFYLAEGVASVVAVAAA